MKPRFAGPSKELQATAYHEAGHAVVHFVLGLAIDKVSIIPGDGYSGVCVAASVLGYTATSARARRSIARDLILGCYAGMHAERLIDPDAPESHGEEDEAGAFQLSTQWGVLPRWISFVGDDNHDRYLNRLRQEAGRLVRRHRRAIAALAKELLRQRELDQESAKAVVGPFLAGMRLA